MRIGGVLLLVGCASTPRAVFEPSDASHVSRPGELPRVYTSARDIPDEPMRSVGIIKVRAQDASRAARAAAHKGREVGCWIVVAHDVFANLRADAMPFGASIVLAHGVAHGGTPVTPPSEHRFDCVVRGSMSAMATST